MTRCTMCMEYYLKSIMQIESALQTTTKFQTHLFVQASAAHRDSDTQAGVEQREAEAQHELSLTESSTQSDGVREEVRASLER